MIAFVAQPYHRGGVTRWMVDAAAEWARRGESVWFVCPTPARPFFTAGSQPRLLTVLDAVDPQHRVQRASVEVGSSYELGTERYRASVILALLRRHVPTSAALVLSDESAIWRAGHTAAEAYRVIGVLHADDEHYYRLAVRHGAALAALVCVSHRIAGKASDQLGWPFERLHRIPCGIPLPPKPIRVVQERSPRLIWVGRIEQRQKRVLDLPRILCAVRAIGVEATLDIVGDGPDTLSLREAIQEAGLETHVRWHGWRATGEVRDLLSTADILVLPSNFEGMPIAVMEALASGCGVVATTVSGLEDYANHPLAGDCYRTHGVGDVKGGADAIAQLLAVPPDARSTSARILAESEFSIERCVDRYADVRMGIRAPAARRIRSIPQTRLAGVTSFPVSTLRRLRVWWRTPKTHASAEGIA